ncbi:hypothetical protein DRJ22_00350 [Candidatus Woesearchaeota archaeon]|nr:MAG: hypothetical protein B6U93_03370 [Candidatus Woesearchaeota archaeon ex4484_78]RLE47007.1 MAG: hypothetical protein DRJ22_00350 [Candidatus Woesearchaeota archaeon]
MSVVLTCRGNLKVFGVDKEKDLAVVVDFHSFASRNPLQYAVFLKKFSSAVDIIRNSNCFAINFAYIKGLPEEFDEFEKTECEKLDCPRLKGSDSWLECEVKHELDLGDYVLFVGSVLFES